MNHCRPMLLLLCLLMRPGITPAQESDSTPLATVDLPDGKQVYDDFLAAIGGREARAKVKTQRMTGKLKMEIPGAGEIAAPIEVLQSSPNKFQLIVDFSEIGAGEINQGTNGELAWEVSPQGKRLLEGAQKTRMLRQADTESTVNPELRYKTIECVGEQEQEGRTVYRVKFVPKDEGPDEMRLFDAETKLLVGTVSTQESAFGPSPVQTALSDYREVDGLKFPFRNAVTVKLPMGEQKQIMEFDEVEVNGQLPAESFAVPEAIKELIAEQEQQAQEAS